MISSIPEDITNAAEAEGCSSPEMRSSHIPTHIMPSFFPRDLLQNFINVTHFPTKLLEDAQLQLDLTLGLSLNNLTRSSSIPDFSQPSTDNGTAAVSHTCDPISMASSLPMEAEDDDECRKRKPMQSLRRMEAKRKRTENQRNSRALNGYSSRVNFEGRPEHDDQKMIHGSLRDYCSKDELLKDTSFERVLYGKGDDFTGENDDIDRVASQGSGSSGLSEFERSSEGSNKCSEARSIAPDNEPKSPSIMAAAPSGYSSNSSASTLGNGQAEPPFPGSGVNGVTRDVLMEMPCVSAVGDGPDGKKIEGFLYRYKKGEEVKIVCVCHGRLLSPAEFVKHAGGTDVSNPLKHIVVNMSPFVQ